MKIYFIGQKGIPAKFGGVERHVEELAIRLAQKGHEVFVYARPNYTKSNLKKYKGVNLINLPSVATKHLDAISHTFRACLDVVKRDADVIHFHSIGPSSLIWLVKLLKRSTPVVATFHTRCYFHKKWGVAARAYLKFGEWVACRFADATITVSRSLTAYAKEKYGSETTYIPNGVGLFKKVLPRKIKKWGLKKDGYILSLGRLIKHKGVHYLIEAFQDLKTAPSTSLHARGRASRAGKKLVIVGGGVFTDDYVRELKESAKGNKNIIFTGSQSGQVLAELFSNAYLFVQPSESEGLSIALLEAMSYGKAALVSDIPENLEAVAEAGFSFRNKDARDLALKLKYLLAHPEAVKRKGEAGRKRVREFYNWSDIVKETINIYKQQIAEKGVEKAAPVGFKLAKKFISFLF